MTRTDTIATDEMDAGRPRPDRTVLVIGEDPTTRASLMDLFDNEGFLSLQAGGIDSAQDVLAGSSVDLIVLDERMSGGRAYGFCRQSAVAGGAPIILLSDNADVIDRIVALEVGADDLLATPVDSRLLMAQARALLRRGAGGRGSAAGRPGGAWGVDLVAREAISPNGRRLRISPHETSLLHLFLDNPGIVFTPETAGRANAVLKDETPSSFRTAMSRLRRKLDSLNCGEVIRNVRGAGYMYAHAVN